MSSYIADESPQVVTDQQSRGGRAMTFDGVNDYISCGSPASLQLSSGAFTISLWYKSSTPVEGGFGSCGSQGWIVSPQRFWYLGAWRNWSSGNGPFDGVWNHVAYTFDSGTLKRYINGYLDQTLTSVTGTYANGGTVVLGNYGGNYFTGQQHDYRIYDRALTAAEIVAMYNATKQSGGDVKGTLYAANLLAHYWLEDRNPNWSIVQVAYDSGPGGYHGKLFGSMGSYTGTDVPSCLMNEIGYAPHRIDDYDAAGYTDLMTPLTYLLAGGSEGKASVLTNQSWNGLTGLSGMKFLNGALAGYAVNRAINANSGGDFTPAANHTYMMVCEIATSRRLVSGESIYFYFTGGQQGPTMLLLPSPNNIADERDFNTYNSSLYVPTSGFQQYLVGFPATNVTGGDLSIFIKRVRYYDLGAQTDTLLTGMVGSHEMPARSQDTTKSVIGASLAYPGKLAKRAQPKGSPCATFDGTNDYAGRDATDFQFTGDYSVSSWVYLGAVQTGRIAGRHESNVGWMLRIESTGAASVWRNANSVASRRLLKTGTWNHIVGVAEGSTGRVYVNGVLDTEGSITSSTHGVATSADMRIARNGTSYLNGRVSDVRVFNRAMSAAEVASVYAGNDIASGLIGSWPCDAKSGLTLLDTSDHGNHLICSGMTTGQLWANTQDNYHSRVARGARLSKGRRGYRTLDGSTQFFSRASHSKVTTEVGKALWFVADFTPLAFDAANGSGIIGKYQGSSFEWTLYLEPVSNQPRIIVYDTAGSVHNVYASASVAGTREFIIGYIDDTGSGGAIGISKNGGAFVTSTYAGIHTRQTSSNFDIGTIVSAATYALEGRIYLAAVGKINSISSINTIRDVLYNSGSPLSYSQLTASQISDFGVQCWYDCDEWGPQLRDKHSGLVLTGTGYDSDYPTPAPSGLVTSPARDYVTFLVDPAGSFNGGDDTHYEVTTGQKLWYAAVIRNPVYSGAGGGIIGKYSSVQEYLLYTLQSSGVNYIANVVFAANGAASSPAAVAPASGDWYLAFGYVDATGGNVVSAVAANAGSFVVGTLVTGQSPRNTTDNFQIGTFFSANQLNGDMMFAAIGKDPTLTMTQVRDILYNGGDFITFDELSAAQKTGMGLSDWFELGEYRGDMQPLASKVSARALTPNGDIIPSATTHGVSGSLPPIDTSIDFTGAALSGGTAAAWTSKQYLGYLTCDGTVGRVVSSAISGKLTGGQISIYARVRNLDFSTSPTILAADNGAGANRAEFYFSSGNIANIWTTTNTPLGPSLGTKFADGLWHDVLLVWSGTSATLYVDGAIWGTGTTPVSFASLYAGLTRAYVLSYANGGTNFFKGDIARLLIADGLRAPSNILSASNILDLRFDGPNCDDEQGRVLSSVWASGHTPAKLTVPTAYKHGVVLPAGMNKSATELGERRFSIFKQDQ